MPVNYSRTFIHQDWEDNRDIVQAGGDNGFNQKFHALEDELDSISNTFNEVNDELATFQRLQLITSRSGVDIAANSVTEEFLVEIYERTGLPENVERVYYPIIFPLSGPTHLQHTFLYRSVPGDRVAVNVIFFNPGEAQARLNFRILALA